MKFGWMAPALVFACVAGAEAADTPVYVHSIMKDQVAPQAQVLWDVGNNALGDDGNVDISKLKPADWAKLGNAAQAMKIAALAMADAPKLTIAPAGVKVQDEGGAGGGATAMQIQAYIDADPKSFADHARALADVSDAFLAESKTRDGKTLGDASANLDQVCEACHMKYWYPEQK